LRRGAFAMSGVNRFVWTVWTKYGASFDATPHGRFATG